MRWTCRCRRACSSCSRELQERFGFATLFITHDLAVVDLLAHKIVVLHKGEIAEAGPTAQVLGDPQDAYTRRLIASLPVPDPIEQAARRAAWESIKRLLNPLGRVLRERIA